MDNSWELEWQYFNSINWVPDYTPPYQPTPTPPDSLIPFNTARYSSLPMDSIVNAIQYANLGLNPQNNGEQLIISVPPLTEERRRDLVKKAKAESENAKIGLRNNRKDALDMIKELKNDGLSEDMMKDAENEVQNITNEFSNKIDEFLSVKEKDIMTV